MIRIYTPKAWRSLLYKYPSIVINDDGYIYSEDYLYKPRIFVDPIGKIDFARGEIYGEDYRRLFAIPIGYIVKNKDVLELYDENYRRTLINYPFAYIKDNQYYTYDEFHKLFRTPSMYIENG